MILNDPTWVVTGYQGDGPRQGKGRGSTGDVSTVVVA